MTPPTITDRIQTRRPITGMSAILLVHRDPETVDWDATQAHIARTHAAGLWPAVNMDTGYVQLLDEATRLRVLDITAEVTGGRFTAGAFVTDRPGDSFSLTGYLAECRAIAERGGIPTIFPSYGLNMPQHGPDGDAHWLASIESIGREVDRFIGFELGSMFVPYGRIVSLETYSGLMEIDSCLGAKHSSLDRQCEWDRLALRDQQRADFKVFTGNDLAIDMVMYGSDYLLGLSTFAPDAFAVRDRLWAEGDAGFHELDDLLQYLGMFTFRGPVPGYRHDAAMFLEMRGWASSDAVPTGALRRPDGDRAVLQEILDRLEVLMSRHGTRSDP